MLEVGANGALTQQGRLLTISAIALSMQHG
jgi:hypothetical protein